LPLANQGCGERGQDLEDSFSELLRGDITFRTTRAFSQSCVQRTTLYREDR